MSVGVCCGSWVGVVGAVVGGWSVCLCFFCFMCVCVLCVVCVCVGVWVCVLCVLCVCVGVCVRTHREGLRSLLDDKALDEVCEDLRFDHSLRKGGPVGLAPQPPGQGQGQGEGGWGGEGCYCLWSCGEGNRKRIDSLIFTDINIQTQRTR